ncbi:MAG: PilC/PilY family type IV pilus protein [Sphaerotilus natans]
MKLLRILLLVLLMPLLLAQRPARAAIDLADAPLFSSASVPGNLLLALSVEYPTASTPAYLNTSAYSASTAYVGYFDPGKCYRYVYNSTTPADSHFAPYSLTTTRTCVSTSLVPLWSGNWLNWASTQTLDAFRWALTGGTRKVDTAAQTILQKTRHPGQGYFPEKVTAGTTAVAGATPFTSAAVVTAINGLGVAMTISTDSPLSCTFTLKTDYSSSISCSTNAATLSCSMSASGTSCSASAGTPLHSLSCTRNTTNGGVSYTYSCTNTQSTATSCSTASPLLYSSSAATSSSCSTTPAGADYVNQSGLGGTIASRTAYKLYIQPKVCDATVGLESNCTKYGTTASPIYKPEGLMQQYASKLRYSAFGYLNDNSSARDGGVMRARMKYIGPTQPVPGSSAIGNSRAEWDSSTGIMLANPDTADTSATIAFAQAQTGLTPTLQYSGVMNYLNRFGSTTGVYKGYDPVSELYYAGLRYYRKLGPVASYNSLSGITTTAALNNVIDGFPVITSWDDPILYSCQKNFIIGIGDVNTWNDANLQGSTIRTSAEPALPAEVAADTEIDVKKATDMVGQLEGWANLGSYSSGRNNSYFMAGLAYHAHTTDLRSDLGGSQTVSTYWVDVLENQYYRPKNQYWLAAKYGGFEVPGSFQPYASSNSTSTIAQNAWYTSSDTVGSNPRPDNYYTGGLAAQMISGLGKAFAKIAQEASASTSTAFASTSLNEASSGNASYAASYDPRYWTGTLLGLSVSYASDGTPSSSEVWNARTLLASTLPTNRRIVTCCTATGAALPFRSASLGAAALSSRTYYASFAAVPGVDTTAQSAANFLDYLRGDRTREQSAGGVYRTRNAVLGDIVNSKVTATGAPASPYYDASNPGYNAFRRSHSSRRTVVYVGANDGMLHAFDGSLSGTTAGTELFAYVPSFVYGDSTTASTRGLAALGNPSYEHRPYVDATPLTFDVDFARVGGASPSASTSDWRTILIGGLGRGGRGYYAIDVTQPDSWTSESVVASKVLWEYTDASLGHGYGDARVVKTAKYGWTVVIASGYNTPDGSASIHLLNPKTGALYEKITLSGSTLAAPYDVAHVTAFIPDLTDYTATALYAGDLQGNLWRIDVSRANGSYPAALKFARLTDASGTGQPVTTPVRVMIEPNSGKRYLLVGTGRLLADSDITSTQTQTLYAIIDGTASTMYTDSTLPSGVSFPVTRAKLAADTDLLSGIGSAPTQPMGWYFDLGSGSTGVAERVTIAPTVTQGLVGVALNLPGGDACTPSGTSRVLAVSFADGRSMLTDSSGNAVALSASSDGLASDITFKNIGGKVRLVAGRSGGGVSNQPGTFGRAGTLRRLNWREVPTIN